MESLAEGNAIVYCEGAFTTPNGKTAHGLVRRSDRYRVTCVIDSLKAGNNSGELLDGLENDIPVVADLEAALAYAKSIGHPAKFFVIGLAPDGGRLPDFARTAIAAAIEAGLNVDSGLHDFITEDEQFVALAQAHNVQLRDIRKPPSTKSLHFFSGKIEQVQSRRIAILGTDSAVGKRTTAWLLTDALSEIGYEAEMIGTGQTAWLQGVRYGVIMDSLVNDFVSGEIENAIWKAWKERKPDVMILEGQGSLLNPAYPGGFELIAAGRPHAIVLQHAPKRRDYDGFPGYPIHSLDKQIKAVELISGRPVAAITLNHEGMTRERIDDEIEAIQKETGLPCIDVLADSAGDLVKALRKYLPTLRERDEY